jgi:DNA-directed RNA polymerase specialized sigma24 family protein
VLKRIRDQIRWAPAAAGPGRRAEFLEDTLPSPLEAAIGGEVLDRYERALEQLPEEARQLIHLQIELDFGTSRSPP